MTPAELAIRAAIIAVEDVGADIRLTQAVTLLSAAQTRLADFIDGINGWDTFPHQVSLAVTTQNATRSTAKSTLPKDETGEPIK